MFKQRKFEVFYSIILIAFTLYMVLDTFVNKEVYKVVDTIVSDETNEIQVLETGKVTSASDIYKDDNIEIKLKEYNYENTHVYVADVQIKSSDFLKTAFANNTYGKNITSKTSSIADSVNAILAINGDYYGVQEKGYVLKKRIKRKIY